MASLDALPVFNHVKSQIIDNATLLYGYTKNGRPRHYQIVSSSQTRTRTEYRVCLYVYDETYKSAEKIDADPKLLLKSAVKYSLNAAIEDLLKNTEEAVWNKEAKEAPGPAKK